LEKKTIDINELINDIRSIVKKYHVVTNDDAPLFGHITIFFRDGVYKNYERDEVGF